MEDTEEKLLFLKLYFDTHRGRGHTYAMVNGVANTDDVIVLVSHQNHVLYIQKMCRKRINYVSWDNLDRLHGAKNALVVDNAALSLILEDALNVIRDLRSENSLLKEGILPRKVLYRE